MYFVCSTDHPGPRSIVRCQLVGGRVGGGGVAGVMRPILGYNALLPHSSHRAACQVITFHLWPVVTWRQLEADPPPGTTMASALLVTLLGLGPGLLALQLSPDLSLDWSLEEVRLPTLQFAKVLCLNVKRHLVAVHN